MGKLTVKKGDITQEDVEVIVNAANKSLLGGGGVDGAIHRVAGPSVLEECRRIGGCATGEAAMTNAGRLKAKRIVHTVGPVWGGGGRGEPELLRNAYVNSLRIAKEAGLRTIAFPAISTGVYGYPIEEAARIAIAAGREFQDDFDEIRFIAFSDGDYEVLEKEQQRDKREQPARPAR